MKKLSIIIPVYNAAKFLKNCLDSIVNYKNDLVEIIVVDDGSTDSSTMIYSQYNDILIFKKKNGGVSSARNFGITKATGEYIMFVDSDDELADNYFLKIQKELEFRDDLYLFSTTYKNELINGSICENILFENNKFLNSPWSKVYKKSIIDTYKLRFNEKIINGEDFLFNLQYSLKCKNCRFVNESIYKYRVTSVSSTKKFNDKIFESDKELYIRLDELFLESKNKKLKNEYLLYKNNIVKNNVYVVFLRLCYMHNYKELKRYTSNFKFYFSIINKDSNIGTFKNFICYFIRKNIYFFPYLIISLKIKLINNYDYLLDI